MFFTQFSLTNLQFHGKLQSCPWNSSGAALSAASKSTQSVWAATDFFGWIFFCEICHRSILLCSFPSCCRSNFRKILVSVRKISVRNSGAGNGCANSMDAWTKSVRSAGKAMSIKLLVLGGGGGGILGLGGGGSADFIFMGARIFLIICPFGTFSPPPPYNFIVVFP